MRTGPVYSRYFEGLSKPIQRLKNAVIIVLHILILTRARLSTKHDRVSLVNYQPQHIAVKTERALSSWGSIFDYHKGAFLFLWIEGLLGF